MGNTGDSAGFASAINTASQLPENTGEGANVDLPKMFSMQIPHGDVVVTDEPAPDAQKIQGVAKYKLNAHFGRFVMGTILQQDDEGRFTIEDNHDDTDKYEEIQNKCLSGEAILCWEKQSFLKDGAVVIAMKWMTKVFPKKDKDVSESEKKDRVS